MRKRIATILIISLILANTFVVKAEIILGVEWREYVPKAEVYAYFATMSDLLERMADVESLTPIIERNPTAKYIRDRNMKRQEKDNGGGQ